MTQEQVVNLINEERKENYDFEEYLRLNFTRITDKKKKDLARLEIDKILEQEYDDNFIVTLEYDINTFNKINENNIYNIIEKSVEEY